MTTPAKPKSPFTAPAGKEVVVLIPYEPGPKARILELLDEYDELPTILDALRLPGLKPEHAVFVVIDFASAGNRPRQIPRDYKLKVGGPIELASSKGGGGSSLDATTVAGDTDYGQFLERVAKITGSNYGLRVSQNKVLTLVSTNS